MPDYIYQDFEVIEVYRQLLNIEDNHLVNFKDQQLVLFAYRKLLEGIPGVSPRDPAFSLIDRTLQHFGDPSKVEVLRGQLHQLERGEIPYVIGSLQTADHYFGFIADRNGIRVINGGERKWAPIDQTYELNVDKIIGIVRDSYSRQINVGGIYRRLGAPIMVRSTVKHQKIGNCFVYSIKVLLDTYLKEHGINIASDERNRAFLEALYKIVEAQRGRTAADTIRPKLEEAYVEYRHFKETGQMSPTLQKKRERAEEAERCFERGVDLVEGKRYIEGISELDHALGIRTGEFAAAHYNKGAALANLDRPDEAMSEYRTAIRIDPYLDEAYLGLGRIYQSKGMRAEATENFLKGLEVNPNIQDPDVREHLIANFRAEAKEAAQSMRIDDAIRSSGMLSRLAPGDIEAHRMLGHLYATKDMRREATEEALTILQLGPGSREETDRIIRILKEEGRTALGENNFTYAERIYSGLAKVIPEEKETHVGLGEAYQGLQRVEEAKAEFTKAFVIDSRDQDLRAYLITTLDRDFEDFRAAGRFKNAFSVLFKQIRLELNNQVYCVLLGQICIDLAGGNIDKAIQFLKDAPENPAYSITPKNLGEVYMHMGSIMIARQEGDKAIKAYKKAAEEYTKVLATNPNDSKTLERIAYCYTQIGHSYFQKRKNKDAAKAYGQACNHYAEALKFNPDNKQARYGLDVCRTQMGRAFPKERDQGT